MKRVARQVVINHDARSIRREVVPQDLCRDAVLARDVHACTGRPRDQVRHDPAADAGRVDADRGVAALEAVALDARRGVRARDAHGDGGAREEAVVAHRRGGALVDEVEGARAGDELVAFKQGGIDDDDGRNDWLWLLLFFK